jgi:hypothetical protein
MVDLEPKLTRIDKIRNDEDVVFEGYFFSEEPVMYKEANLFANAWVDLWGSHVPINLIDAPPPNFTSPTTLDFSPSMRRNYEEFKISNTSFGPLWGQHISYFDDNWIELNAGPRQNDDSHVKYQQNWVEQNLYCPFCFHTDWNLTYAVSLKEPERIWYDPEDTMYALVCPRCERVVEAIPKELIG